MEGYVGQWSGKQIQKPSQFQRKRKIGEHTIMLPKPPAAKDIIGYGLPRKEQKIPRGVIPDNFESLSKEERIRISVEEWRKRRYGVWFYNNGTIEYITGIHYFYVSYWKIDIGLPDFRDSDRDLHYVWDYCVEDTECFGLAYFTGRRSGKTAVGTNIIYEYASRKDWNPKFQTEESECGIQSKTMIDGKKVFSKLISSWRKLHPLWRPTDTGVTHPKNDLRFEAPSKRSSKGEKKIYDTVLNSVISFKSSTEDAYDGFKLKRIIQDEFGKYTDGNAYDRWDITKPCFVTGTTIIGKAYLITTVEEMENKGGKEAKDIYDNSDINNRKKDGRTTSGLYRLFKPAYYGLEGYIDEYGYSDIKAAKSALLNQRDGLEGSKLAGEVRKFPFTAKEAFYSSAGSQVFSSQKIFEQKEYNETLKKSTTRRGNFMMTDEETQKVEFFDDPDGFFEVSWMPDEEKRCVLSYDSRGLLQPVNDNEIFIAVDPVDHKDTVSTKQSNAAATAFRRFNAADPSSSNCFIMSYLGRRPDPELFYKDIVNAAIFYGAKVLVENQKPGLLNMMNREDYQNFMYKTKQSDYTKSSSHKRVEGVSMAGNLVRQQAIDGLSTYIYKYIGKISREVQKKELGIKEEDISDEMYGNCPFPELLDDWNGFDANNWRIYDSTVAAMICLLAATPVRKKAKPQVEEKETNNKSFFPTYKL